MQGAEFWKSKITESLKNSYIENPEDADYSHLYDAAAETLRGILAEKENLPPEQIRLNIEPLDTSSIGDFSDEIESNIGSMNTLF